MRRRPCRCARCTHMGARRALPLLLLLPELGAGVHPPKPRASLPWLVQDWRRASRCNSFSIACVCRSAPLPARASPPPLVLPAPLSFAYTNVAWPSVGAQVVPMPARHSSRAATGADGPSEVPVAFSYRPQSTAQHVEPKLVDSTLPFLPPLLTSEYRARPWAGCRTGRTTRPLAPTHLDFAPHKTLHEFSCGLPALTRADHHWLTVE